MESKITPAHNLKVKFKVVAIVPKGKKGKKYVLQPLCDDREFDTEAEAEQWIIDRADTSKPDYYELIWDMIVIKIFCLNSDLHLTTD